MITDQLKTTVFTKHRSTPQQLSRELREKEDTFLDDRRQVFGYTLLAAGAISVVALYQMGLIRHIPEPPLPFLDADKVDASEEAYEWLGTPDGVLGLRNYATTAVLAAMGGKDRTTKMPWLPLLMAAKVSADTFQALRLTRSQWTKHGAFCSWCLTATAASLGTVRPAFREAKAALQSLLE